MSRRLFSILAAAALIASALTLAPAKAAPEVPSDDDANIIDQSGDANYHSTATGAAASPSLVAADIVKVWFTHDAQTISTHIQTAGATQPPSSLLYRVFVDPGAGSNCLQIRGFTGAPGNPSGEATGSIRDLCDGDTVIDGEFVQEEGPPVLEDGRASGLHTIIMPRDAHPAFSDGAVLATPEAETRHFTVAVTAPIIDDTEIGTEYTITSGGGGGTKAKPPGKNNPPGQGNQKCAKIKNKKKKKKCLKNSGKQKGKKKKKKSKACGNFQPGELGAEAETIKITEAATEEEPLEQTVELEQSTADVAGDVTMAYFNVQADTKPKDDVGLWVLFEFPTRRDYDLALFHPDGSYAARSRGFNTAYETPFSTAGHGGEHADNYEKLLGIRTARCGGWTLEASNHLGEGGEFAIKLWLGEVQTDPLAPGEESPE